MCAVVKKLASPEEVIRSKVLELLNLLSTRIKAAHTIQLPAESLVATFKEAPTDMVRNMALVYLEQALARMPDEDRLSMVPFLLMCPGTAAAPYSFDTG